MPLALRRRSRTTSHRPRTTLGRRRASDTPLWSLTPSATHPSPRSEAVREVLRIDAGALDERLRHAERHLGVIRQGTGRPGHPSRPRHEIGEVPVVLADIAWRQPSAGRPSASPIAVPTIAPRKRSW